MTIKIAHIADTHLGYRQYGLIEREEDYYDNFRKITNDILEKNIDYVIHCGDLFEQPKPPIKALLTAQECFTKMIENGIEIFVIAGNHDIQQRRKTVLPQELYLNDKFHILSTKNNNVTLKEDIFLAGIPYLQKSFEDKIKEILYELASKAETHKHKILMLHGSIKNKFEFNPEFENETIPKGFDYYAMGHIHQRILEKDFHEGILSYPGSTEIKDKGEIQDWKNNKKGYNLLTIDDKINIEYVNIQVERKFIDKSIKYTQLDESLDEIENEIKNDILVHYDKKPVLILTVKEGNFDRSDVASRVYEKLEDLALTIRLSYQPSDDENEPENETPIELSPEEIIKKELEEIYQDESIGQFGVELYSALTKNKISDAEEITEEYYKKRYYNN